MVVVDIDGAVQTGNYREFELCAILAFSHNCKLLTRLHVIVNAEDVEGFAAIEAQAGPAIALLELQRQYTHAD
ncbi:hypothetical protein D3C80_2171700 [compost metagenome]